MLRALFALIAVAAAAGADTFELVKEESIFAVVTHKGGIGAAKAHNHIIYPSSYKVDIRTEGENLTEPRFSIVFPANTLTPDVPEVQKRWFPRLKALGIVDEEFAPVSAADRRKIHETMLSEAQLDAARFPDMSAEVVKIEPKEQTVGDTTFTHDATLTFTAHGKTVEKTVPARIELKDDVLFVEAVAEYRFTDFGVKPYSAFLGTLKNKDQFHVYVNFTARRVSA